MKILFLHLSDAHLTGKTFIDDTIIDAQVQAINAAGDFDKCCLVFSGDLSYSAKQNEYAKCKLYLRRLWKRIMDKFHPTYPVSTLMVPGNHDMDFGGNNRGRAEIARMLSSDITDEMIRAELRKFNNFYEFAEAYHCFSFNKLIDVKTYNIDTKKVQINLINSELFATCNDEFGDDDKGKHFLPESEWGKLARGQNVDLVVTISHRGPEWFNWESSNSFKKKLYTDTDLFLYGHEHIDDVYGVCQKDNYLVKSIAQGINFTSKSISFTMISVDLDTNQINTILFAWDDKQDMFVRQNVQSFEIEKQRNTQYLIEPSTEYVDLISQDENKCNLKEYFVFPGIEIIDQKKNKELHEFEEFLSLIENHKQVIVEAEESSGKSSLLYRTYLSLIGNYVPIYLNEGNIIGKNPERAIRAAFEEQYANSDTSYEKFIQIDRDKKVILLDDLNKIKPQYVKPLQEYVKSNFGHIVMVIEPKWKIDMVEIAKEQLSGTDSVIKVQLLPFYSSKRLELIQNLIKVYNGNFEDTDKEAESINTFIRDQIKIFSLSPKFINMYVEYCIRDAEMATTSNRNVFGRVFESNMINSIRRFASESDVDEFSVLLEDIAYNIHFNEKYPLSATDLSAIIDEYNENNLMKGGVQRFCEVMTKSKILVEENNEYYFYNNSYLAYFVAKSLNSRYNNGEGQGELERIAQNICFNINGDILLFLSYITSNIGILRFIQHQAESHMSNWHEFDMDTKNIGFLFNVECPISERELPSESDRKKKDERVEKYEKSASKHDAIERVALYDYDRSDTETEDYKIAQALRFTELICKIMSGFNHRLKRDDKITLASDVYAFPNKIAYRMLQEIDQNFDEIVSVILKIIKENNQEITEEKVKEALINSAETVLLNLYNNCARLSVTTKTIEAMNLVPKNNTNYKIQHIMMLENLGKFNAFTAEANELFDSTGLHIVKSMITRIVHKHFLYNKKLKLVGNVESVARKYFGQSFKKADLLK